MVKIFKDKSNPDKLKHSITTESQKMMGKVSRVRDVMTEDPLIFKLGMTVHDAAKKLLQKSVVAAPVGIVRWIDNCYTTRHVQFLDEQLLGWVCCGNGGGVSPRRAPAYPAQSEGEGCFIPWTWPRYPGEQQAIRRLGLQFANCSGVINLDLCKEAYTSS